MLKVSEIIAIHNSGAREYAENHNGSRLLALEEIHPPVYTNIHLGESITFARKVATGGSFPHQERSYGMCGSGVYWGIDQKRRKQSFRSQDFVTVPTLSTEHWNGKSPEPNVKKPSPQPIPETSGGQRLKPAPKNKTHVISRLL